jgi:hypothetical protein
LLAVLGQVSGGYWWQLQLNRATFVLQVVFLFVIINIILR